MSPTGSERHAAPVADRFDPFALHWYVVVNDLVGGWAISHINKPLSQQDSRKGEGDIFDALTKELAEYIVALHNARIDGDPVQAIVDEQAEDEGLWFIAETAAEAYLQQELRRLHAAIEAAL